MLDKKIRLFATLQFILLTLLTLWSYTLTDPNLVLTSWAPYWNFQQTLWQIPAQTKATMYALLITLLVGDYLWFGWSTIRGQLPQLQYAFKSLLIVFLISSFPLLFSYNALSHDVFNYIFNARMVLKYQADPHVQVALNFSPDEWLRFMHNVHTPAPYWYGWTALSLPPYILGLGKFTLTWLLFRVWSVIGVIILFCGVATLLNTEKNQNSTLWLWLFIFNPLLIIELIMNTHNDGWMMACAVWSFVFVLKAKRHSLYALFSILLLLASVSTKYVTAVLFPVWGALLAQGLATAKLPLFKFLLQLKLNLLDLASVLLFLPLLSARSQWFHPWYLIWSLSFLPLMKHRWLKVFLLSLSISSLYRYLPWMNNGAFEFTDEIQVLQRVITWGGGVLLFLLLGSSQLWSRNSQAQSKMRF